MSDHSPDWPALLERLRRSSSALATTADWPREPFGWLAQADVLRWGIPPEFGGLDIAPADAVQSYIDLADACLVTTFVLTQRNAAVQRIVVADGCAALQRELLPRLARNELFATVGISHLTTSRQHLGRPAVLVELEQDHLVLTGEVPWVTGAIAADVVVTGGTTTTGEQYLVALPTNLGGVRCEPPEELLALSASQTCRVILDRVQLPRERVLAGPAPRVLQQGTGAGTGSLTTSALAAGLSQRAVRLLEEEAARRADLRDIVNGLAAESRRLVDDLVTSATADNAIACGSPESLRERANSLALRSTQALLAASKGAGFVAGHPAERAVREALFFLVWSCPQPVVNAALRGFACLAE
jgi:alkylation response protein AidB-like acyl-CoA dehydrogenase